MENDKAEKAYLAAEERCEVRDLMYEAAERQRIIQLAQLRQHEWELKQYGSQFQGELERVRQEIARLKKGRKAA